MGIQLQKIEIFRLNKGFRSEGLPCCYEVDGMSKRLIMWDGSPEGRWLIWKTDLPYAADQDYECTFSSAEDALTALQLKSEQ